MNTTRTSVSIIIPLFGMLFLASCISNNKHALAVSSLENSYEAMLQKAKAETDSLVAVNGDLTLKLATKTGENNALLLVQDRLQDRLDILQGQIEDLNSIASNQKSSLQKAISEKESKLLIQQEQIKELRNYVQDAYAQIGELAKTISDSLSEEIQQQYLSTKISNGDLYLMLTNSQLFRNNRIELQRQGAALLQKIFKILEGHPDKYFHIISHTDNVQPRSRNYRDNWDVSVLRSSSIAQFLVGELGFNPNQIIIGGKGEFAPLTSNETEEGRTRNKRVEIRITKGKDQLLRYINRELDAIADL